MQDRNRVFISYSHHDKRWLSLVRQHLGVLKLTDIADIFDDTLVGPGEHWRRRLEEELLQARVGLLLISPAFLDSDFVRTVELPTLFERNQNNGLILFPLLLRPCAWDVVPWLSGLQARPRGAKAISELRGASRDQALAEASREVFELLKKPEIHSSSIAGGVATVTFEIVEGFDLKDGIDALEAKMIELTQTQESANFEIDCSWLKAIEQQINTIRTKATLSRKDEAVLLQTTKLRQELLDKVDRLTWMLETLLSNDTLKESSIRNGQSLSTRHLALCLRGIIEIENYTARSQDDWGIFRRSDRTGWPLYLSSQQKESMEKCYYHEDERCGVSEFEAYSIAYFLTADFAERVLPTILTALSRLNHIKSDPKSVSEFLDITTWYFGKDLRADLLRFVPVRGRQ